MVLKLKVACTFKKYRQNYRSNKIVKISGTIENYNSFVREQRMRFQHFAWNGFYIVYIQQIYTAFLYSLYNRARIITKYLKFKFTYYVNGITGQEEFISVYNLVTIREINT